MGFNPEIPGTFVDLPPFFWDFHIIFGELIWSPACAGSPKLVLPDRGEDIAIRLAGKPMDLDGKTIFKTPEIGI